MLTPIALAEGSMKLTERCVIEQPVGRILRMVAHTNLGLLTPDAAALVVRAVRGQAAQMSNAPKRELDGNVVLSVDFGNACGQAWRPRDLSALRLQRSVRHSGTPVTPDFGRSATMAEPHVLGWLEGITRECSCLVWNTPSRSWTKVPRGRLARNWN